MSKILFLTGEDNIHIFELLCNVLVITWSEVGTSQETVKRCHEQTVFAGGFLL